MKNWVGCVLAGLACMSFCSCNANELAVDDGGICCSHLLDEEQIGDEQTEKNPSELLVEQAIASFREQEQEKAFNTFLRALEGENKRYADVNVVLQAEDIALYEELLPVYLGLKGHAHHEVPKIIQEKIEVVARSNNSYYLCKFLLAASYANQGRFADFFPLFYSSYSHLPEHYLAHKTKAALHLKLMERANNSVDREKQRALIFTSLEKANKEYPKDPTIYKMMLLLATEEMKRDIIAKYMTAIINGDVIVPRIDIPFYVQHAVSRQMFDLAQTFINKAKGWYQVSKVVTAAQEYLDQKQKER